MRRLRPRSFLIGFLLLSSQAALAADVVYFQMPPGFDIKKFPFKASLQEPKLATPGELKVLQQILDEAGLPKALLLSDFNGDGIRDFTITQSGGKIIVSAEDPDWDGDGIPNLVDPTVGQVPVGLEPSAFSSSNAFDVQGFDALAVQKAIQAKGITVLSVGGSSHDALVLSALKTVLSRVDAKNVKYFSACRPVASKGDRVFFSYVSQSENLEFYPELFKADIEQARSSRYRSASLSQFVNGYVLPLIVHSLLHELGHAVLRDQAGESALRQAGWSWKDEMIPSTYLKAYRLKRKAITSERKNVAFKGKSFESWLAEKKRYEAALGSWISHSAESFRSEAKKSEWSTGTQSLEKEFQLSLLRKVHAPSYYSLSSPEEWSAEYFAAKHFPLFFPKSDSLDESTRYELLIGLRPDAATGK